MSSRPRLVGATEPQLLSIRLMTIEKYGVENRKELLEEELKEVRKQLSEKVASAEEFDHLVRRAEDLKEAIDSIVDQ